MYCMFNISFLSFAVLGFTKREFYALCTLNDSYDILTCLFIVTFFDPAR
jgi:hypothetical protein